MKVRLLAEALHDLEVGAQFYEAQQEGLGAYFLASLEADIESLKVFAGIHEKYRGFYRALSSRFPLAI